jgi:hypothetical protein
MSSSLVYDKIKFEHIFKKNITVPKYTHDTMNPPFKVSLENIEFEHKAEKSCKWKKYNTEITDLWLRPFYLQEKTLNQGTLNAGFLFSLLFRP